MRHCNPGRFRLGLLNRECSGPLLRLPITWPVTINRSQRRGKRREVSELAESDRVLRRVWQPDDSTTPVLQLKGVGKTYRRGDEQVHVLVDFDFTLDAGEFVVVTGPSGAGKSPLLHVAGALRSDGATSDSSSSSSTWCRC